MLIAATDWGMIGVIVAIIAIGVTIGVGIWQVRASRAKSRVSVTAHVDETWHLEVVVSNERGSNAVSITSIAPIVSGHVVDGPEKFARKTIKAGRSEQWSFDLTPPADAPAEPKSGMVKVRVDSGEKHWVAGAKLGHPIIS